MNQKARITVLFDGKPLMGAKIEVWSGQRAGETLVLLTDDKGQAVLPELPPGKYWIRASPTPDSIFGAAFGVCLGSCPENDLDVTDLTFDSLNGRLHPIDRSALGLSEIRMDLAPDRDPQWLPLIAAAEIAAAEKEPIVSQMKDFRGVVLDQSGAVVPGALVYVVQKGAQGGRLAVWLSSDKAGAFSAKLADGDYVVVVTSPGFRSYAICLTIAPTGSASELHVVLTVGSTTQAITLNANRPRPDSAY